MAYLSSSIVKPICRLGLCFGNLSILTSDKGKTAFAMKGFSFDFLGLAVRADQFSSQNSHPHVLESLTVWAKCLGHVIFAKKGVSLNKIN